MIGKTERVVLVQGDASKWYEQAIFIIKPGAEDVNTKLDPVAEAEKIIKEYKLRKEIGSSATQCVVIKQQPKRDYKLQIAMFVGCIIIAAVLAFGLLR